MKAGDSKDLTSPHGIVYIDVQYSFKLAIAKSKPSDSIGNNDTGTYTRMRKAASQWFDRYEGGRSS
jgi:hypothetical protein